MVITPLHEAKNRDRLQGFTQAHLVGQDAIDTVGPQLYTRNMRY